MYVQKECCEVVMFWRVQGALRASANALRQQIANREAARLDRALRDVLDEVPLLYSTLIICITFYSQPYYYDNFYFCRSYYDYFLYCYNKFYDVWVYVAIILLQLLLKIHPCHICIICKCNL